jgi:hypothetical protein
MPISQVPAFHGSNLDKTGGNSSLPPIAGGIASNMNNSNSKQLQENSIGNTSRSNYQASQRRKKKVKPISGTSQDPQKSARKGQNTEQVLRTYGLAGKTAILNSNDTKSDVKIDSSRAAPTGSGISTNSTYSNSVCITHVYYTHY